MWPWSRIKALETELELKQAHLQIAIGTNETLKRRLEQEKSLQALALANARLITKLEPIYGIPETDPKRRAESDAISDAVIKRLLSEHKLSNPHG